MGAALFCLLFRSFALAAVPSPPLVTMMALRSAGYDCDPVALEHHIEAVEVPDALFETVELSDDMTWRAVVESVYGTDVDVNGALGVLLLANPSVPVSICGNRTIGDSALKDKQIRMPSPALTADFYSFVSDLTVFTGAWFDQNLEKGSFTELERIYRILHDRLLPLKFPKGKVEAVEGKNPLKQYIFDHRILVLMKDINNRLYKLISSSQCPWEDAWQVRDNIISIQQQMVAAIDDPHIIVKDGLRQRYDGYESRFRNYLGSEILRRQKSLVTALSGNDIEKAREIVHSILYQLKPAVSDIIPSHKEQALYEELALVHKRYIAPVTRERSLAFANQFSRIASLLTSPGKSDNYKMGFKISDVEFQFLKQSHELLLHTDCSGFIGRIYRELARIAGMDMSTFIVSKSGVIGSIYLIEKKVSVPVSLTPGANPCKNMLQGDYFYFERLIRGERQRHVVFFDRLVKDPAKGLMMSLWEASPGGVKHRVKPLNWVLRWVRSSYGAPRNGVYRLRYMDKIDSVLELRGFTS